MSFFFVLFTWWLNRFILLNLVFHELPRLISLGFKAKLILKPHFLKTVYPFSPFLVQIGIRLIRSKSIDLFIDSSIDNIHRVSGDWRIHNWRKNIIGYFEFSKTKKPKDQKLPKVNEKLRCWKESSTLKYIWMGMKCMRITMWVFLIRNIILNSIIVNVVMIKLTGIWSLRR